MYEPLGQKADVRMSPIPHSTVRDAEGPMTEKGRKCSVKRPIDHALVLDDHGLFHRVLKQHSLKVKTEGCLRL